MVSCVPLRTMVRLNLSRFGGVRRQPNSDKLALKLRRSFVALAYQEGVPDECQNKSKSGVGGQRDSS